MKKAWNILYRVQSQYSTLAKMGDGARSGDSL